MNRITRLELGDETESEARALVQILIAGLNNILDIGKLLKEAYRDNIVVVLKNHPVSLCTHSCLSVLISVHPLIVHVMFV